MAMDSLRISSPGDEETEQLSSVKDKLRDNGIITNAAAKQYIKKCNQSNEPKPTTENTEIETTKRRSINNILSKFPWSRKSCTSELDESHNYPSELECGNFLSQAQKKVAESSKSFISRRSSSKQQIALMNLSSSMKWTNMSGKWSHSSKNLYDDDDNIPKVSESDVLSRRGSEASDEWMLSESAIKR